ncbi:TrbI/VirB10 family protein [Novosphingobium decolorationis]|uniref:TrbI/VirB10 family protein n=1 Tax=Novosphingobium decolorationis TaxID=2698673 RepID=A0ABX8E821_9SPHN|nr:TrbI/VirB10 family protein [Novosphingobium decolorationis]QVM85278.1 TrbI/VirB10 family protein [Novosphingobium decolorationis]
MTETASKEPAAKGDPESFQLRATPARAIRFRRDIVIGAALLGSAALAAIAFMALRPQVFPGKVDDKELTRPATNAEPETLTDLPASYGDAPRLGPPLPGDLGRPILRAQERSQVVSTSGQAGALATQRQQRLAGLKAARESSLLAQVSTPGKTEADGLSPGSGAVSAATPSAPSEQTRKERFASTPDTSVRINPQRLVAPASPRSLLAGSVIPASLITELNSDLPGMVIAQVTQNVYDTVTGSLLLIPQGSRLIGKYDSVVAFGQKRALVVWQRLILPDGRSVQLGNMPATDPSGYAGLADKVDFHTWTLLKGVGIATLLGVGSELSISGESDLVEAIRQSAQTSAARAGDQVTQQNLTVQPTITIRPGAPVRVVVTRDLILDS